VWWAILALMALLVGGVNYFFQSEERRKWWHRVVLSMPLYGRSCAHDLKCSFLKHWAIFSPTRSLSTAPQPGEKHHDQSLSRERLGAWSHSSRRRLAQPGSGKTGAARPLVVDMVRVGEQTGELAVAVRKAAERFDAQ